MRNSSSIRISAGGGREQCVIARIHGATMCATKYAACFVALRPTCGVTTRRRVYFLGPHLLWSPTSRYCCSERSTGFLIARRGRALACPTLFHLSQRHWTPESRGSGFCCCLNFFCRTKRLVIPNLIFVGVYHLRIIRPIPARRHVAARARLCGHLSKV